MLLEYAFLDETNKKPFLGVTIERYKLISCTSNNKIIFIDRENKRRYLSELRRVLDAMATNITRRYRLECFHGNELRAIAEEFDPENTDSLIDALQIRIRELQNRGTSLIAEGVIYLTKAGIRITKEVISNDWFFNIVSSQVVGGANSQNEQNIQNSQPQPPNSNETDINSRLKALNVAEECMDDAFNGLANFNVAQLIYVEKAQLERMKNCIEEKKSYMIDFINILKLYIRIIRINRNTIYDYEGIIIEERINGTGFNEYIVRDIKRFC